MGKFRRTNYTWGVMANPSSSCPDAALCCAHLRSFVVLAFNTLFQLKVTGTKGWFLFVNPCEEDLHCVSGHGLLENFSWPEFCFVYCMSAIPASIGMGFSFNLSKARTMLWV